jgi:hypothetical protein
VTSSKKFDDPIFGTQIIPIFIGCGTQYIEHQFSQPAPIVVLDEPVLPQCNFFMLYKMVNIFGHLKILSFSL